MPLIKRSKVPTGRQILKIIPNARIEWRNMTPLQKHYFRYGIAKSAAGIVGFPQFQETQEVKWSGYMFTIGLLLCCLIGISMIIYHLAHGGIVEILPPQAMLCMGSMTSLFCVTLLSKKRHLVQSILDFPGQYIYYDDHDDPEYQRICSKFMDKSMRNFLTKMGVMMIGYSAAMSGPIYAYFADGIITTTVELSIPFLKPYQELAVNMIIQFYAAIIAGILYLLFEIILDIYRNVIEISPQLIGHRLRSAISAYAEKRISENELRVIIRDIERQAVDTDRLAASINDVLYWRNLFVPPIYTYSIGMAIYAQYTTNYASGYGIAIMSWTQLFFICEIGSSMENNGFFEILHGVDWYLLPTDLQKDIGLLLSRQVEPIALSIGPFNGANLNREVFKIITNKIYTLVMFMLNFTK